MNLLRVYYQFPDGEYVRQIDNVKIANGVKISHITDVNAERKRNVILTDGTEVSFFDFVKSAYKACPSLRVELVSGSAPLMVGVYHVDGMKSCDLSRGLTVKVVDSKEIIKTMYPYQYKFKVQGESKDNGELIIGFPINVDPATGECTEICVGGSSTVSDNGRRHEVGYCYEVNPATVHPVIVEPIKTPNGWTCLSCNQTVADVNYCPECGQCLKKHIV